MSAVIADTHALLWYLNNDSSLSNPARSSFENAENTGQPIYVPSIVIVEMRYLGENSLKNDFDFLSKFIRANNHHASF